MKKESKNQETIREQPVTYDIYAAMPDDGNRYEIVDGMLELMSPGPSTPHQSVSGELVYILKNGCRNEYMIFSAPLDVIFSQKDVRQPDIMMIHRSRLHIVTVRGVEGAPDLIVEILSPGTRKRDKVGKAQTYASYGVPEYWVVDPVAMTLERYLLSNNVYELNDIFEQEDTVISEKLPCVSFKLKDIFSELQNLG